MGKQGEKKPHAPRNYELTNGVMRFSKGAMYRKRGVFKLKNRPTGAAKKSTAKTDNFVMKPIGGDKNGKERRVAVNKDTKVGEFRVVTTKRTKKPGSPPCKLRPSLQPGTVCILLAGVHKGKRCVFLKQMQGTGLMLVTGPMKLNNIPMRRVSSCFVIATKTRIDLQGLNLPEHLTDDYFKRAKKPRKIGKKDDGDIFAQPDKTYVVSDQRKADQKQVDEQLIGLIKKREDKKAMFGYLGSTFSLGKNQYPHQMVF